MMKLIILSNVWSRVSLDKLELARNFLSYDKEYWKRGRFGKTKCKYKCYLVSKNGYFFTGLIPLLQDKFHTIIKDSRPEIRYRKYRIKDINGVGLRDYQIHLIRTGIYSGRGVLKAPTGSGKTFVIAGLIYSLKNCNALVIVNTKTLLRQTAKKLEEIFNEEIGKIGDGHRTTKRITIGMIQSLSRLSDHCVHELNSSINMLIVDEVHHAQSDSYIKFLKQINAPFRYGLSATPKEIEDGGDYLRVVGILGPILEDVKYEEIQDVMPVPHLIMAEYNWQDIHCGEWKDVYNMGIVNSKERNNKIAEIANEYAEHNISVLIMVKLLCHGYILKDLIPKSIFIKGEDSATERENVRQMLQDKRACVVIATSVFGEGVDIPDLDVLINAGGGFSKILTLQRAGRVLRKTKSKVIGTVIDFWDDGNKYLIRHSKRRFKAYKEYGMIEINV